MFFDTASQLWLSPVWFPDSMCKTTKTCRIQNIRLRFGWISRFEFLFFFKRVPFACLCQSYFSGSHQIYQPEIQKPRGRFSAPSPTLVRIGESWDSVRVVGDGSSTIRSDLRFGWRWFFLGHEWAWNIFDFFCLTLSWLEEVQLEDGSLVPRVVA